MQDVRSIAEELSSSRYRFLTDIQIGVLRRKYGASRDIIRTAAVMADRLRRQRQDDEKADTFRIADMIPFDAPIILKDEKAAKAAKRRFPYGERL